jgi:putative redox protein
MSYTSIRQMTNGPFPWAVQDGRAVCVSAQPVGMAIKRAVVTLDGSELRFVGRTGSGHTVVLDSSAGDTGARPAELVPLALAGCTAMDVISILRKKRQEVVGYAVEAVGFQDDDHPNAFSRVDVTHVVEGHDLDETAVRRAIELSATKYCSVGATLAGGEVEVRHGFLIRDARTGSERRDEVVTVGPRGSVAGMVAASV